MSCGGRTLNNTENGHCDSNGMDQKRCESTTDINGKLCKWDGKRCTNDRNTQCSNEVCENRSFNNTENGRCESLNQDRDRCNSTTDWSGYGCSFQGTGDKARCVSTKVRCAKKICYNRTFGDTENGNCDSIGQDKQRCHSTTDRSGWACTFKDGKCQKLGIGCNDRVCVGRNGQQTDKCASIGSDSARCKRSVNRDGWACVMESGQCRRGNNSTYCKPGISAAHKDDKLRSGYQYITNDIGYHNTDESKQVQVQGMRVQGGHEFCVFQDINAQGDKYCRLGPGEFQIPNSTNARSMKSYRLRKDCGEPKWMWDSDCDSTNPNKVLNSCRDKSGRCYQQRITYCNSLGDRIDANCVKFCKANNGNCDSLMIRYCALQENKDKPECSCLNSPALKYNPVCVDGKCLRTGYATRTMMDKQCPSVVDCSVYYDVKDAGGTVEFTDNHIEQRCTSTVVSAPAPAVPAPVPTHSDPRLVAPTAPPPAVPAHQPKPPPTAAAPVPSPHPESSPPTPTVAPVPAPVPSLPESSSTPADNEWSWFKTFLVFITVIQIFALGFFVINPQPNWLFIGGLSIGTIITTIFAAVI